MSFRQKLASLKSVRWAVAAAAALGPSGCVGIADAVGERMGEPPAWFEDARKEMRGEGYPELRDIPSGQSLPASVEGPDSAIRAQLETRAESLENDPRAEPPPPAEEDARARAARLRAQVEQPATP